VAVLVLMYHHTPDGAPEGFYDVGLSTFRDQIAAMRDAGVSFIRFTDCDRPEYVERGVHVALTFDDGHATNEAAFRILADLGLTPMAFIVRDAELADELAASRDYVGTVSGRPAATMALPGGHGGARELAAAERAGFKLVANSRPLPHRRLGIGVNRICVNRTHDARAPLRWAQAGSLHWTKLRARFAATATARRLMGDRLYGALTALAK